MRPHVEKISDEVPGIKSLERRILICTSLLLIALVVPRQLS